MRFCSCLTLLVCQRQSILWICSGSLLTTFISGLIRPWFIQHVKYSLNSMALCVVRSLKSDRSNMSSVEIIQYSNTHIMVWLKYKHYLTTFFGMAVEWSTLLIAYFRGHLWCESSLTMGTYQLRLVSSVFHVIFSFICFITFDTLGGLHAFRKTL